MATNKPTGDNARRGAVKKRSQTKTTLGGASTWTKRDTTSGEFLAVKKAKKSTAKKAVPRRAAAAKKKDREENDRREEVQGRPSRDGVPMSDAKALAHIVDQSDTQSSPISGSHT
jgi:hypothetical protein